MSASGVTRTRELAGRTARLGRMVLIWCAVVCPAAGGIGAEPEVVTPQRLRSAVGRAMEPLQKSRRV
jgi:hypothetical protein